MTGVFAHWKKVHTERLDHYTRLIVELDDAKFCASLIGRGWSAGTGQWFDVLQDAIEDGRALYRKRCAQMKRE